jgi:hypothetical protein
VDTETQRNTRTDEFADRESYASDRKAVSQSPCSVTNKENRLEIDAKGILYAPMDYAQGSVQSLALVKTALNYQVH